MINNFSKLIQQMICVTLLSGSVFAAEKSAEKSNDKLGEKRSRVEEILLWKLSDELKLNVVDERKLSESLRQINQKKIEANQKLESLIREMDSAKSTAEKQVLFNKYKSALKTYSQLNSDEIEKIQKEFGVERAVQYLLVKSDMTSRLKTILTVQADKSKDKSDTPGVGVDAESDLTSNSNKKLPDPKIIEE